MHKTGYIKMPRVLATLPRTARALLTYICTEAQYCQTEHPVAGTLYPGEMATSRSVLMREVGLTDKEVRVATEWLETNNYIAVETSARYTKIAVTWEEFAVLNGYDIMLKGKARGQAKGQAKGQQYNKI